MTPLDKKASARAERELNRFLSLYRTRTLQNIGRNLTDE
jgi:hypothetical protein